MLRGDMLEKTGLLDEKFFMYTEEVDLCQRVRTFGHRVYYTPDAEIVHLGGKSTETNREKAAREYRRSQLYFYSKHYGQAKLQIVRIYLLVKLALRWVLGGTSRRPLQRKLIELVWNF